MKSHETFMKLALSESRKALPDCLPNPPVGCLLVKGGIVVASGYTKAPGRHHAEADALERYAGSLAGITAYVTLEPCSFHGRTPSCAEALIKRGLERIVVALVDPDPRNNGLGLEKLKRAGVEVVEGICSDEVGAFLNAYLNGGQ
ncbi:MAG: bifunctional diaminohydroxyphosphoribosylaminopyrimidine deaminase/5-amino-6-(5-phosphoribosylamino)uracil reductase RibD [Saccharospirillum sp.]|uniref:bifunctional diaminohydroxyphosphoribosylaminopyrimidine deaminase/5-amino-6-(5-phosphoribosylamino)uracil reductase RibD n=1 Tax=Saccharospirillum sp. TaxID=2033801 RepID=UPI003296FA2A